jgi:hypothetical protein
MLITPKSFIRIKVNTNEALGSSGYEQKTKKTVFTSYKLMGKQKTLQSKRNPGRCN